MDNIAMKFALLLLLIVYAVHGNIEGTKFKKLEEGQTLTGTETATLRVTTLADCLTTYVCTHSV